jgi:hypothetical protein
MVDKSATRTEHHPFEDDFEWVNAWAASNAEHESKDAPSPPQAPAMNAMAAAAEMPATAAPVHECEAPSSAAASSASALAPQASEVPVVEPQAPHCRRATAGMSGASSIAAVRSR